MQEMGRHNSINNKWELERLDGTCGLEEMRTNIVSYPLQNSLRICVAKIFVIFESVVDPDPDQ
jgi:hypothetical protein